MITILAAALLCSIASAGQPRPAPAAPASEVHASTATAPSALAAAALGVSTYTVSTLYTGDKARDPFLSGGRAPQPVSSGKDDKKLPFGVDIHALKLSGIMKDAKSDFAIFSTDTGATLILRDNRLYDSRNKRVPGITGSINIKQKRAELITADKDRQPYSLGEPDVIKVKDNQPDETEKTGSGRSP